MLIESSIQCPRCTRYSDYPCVIGTFHVCSKCKAILIPQFDDDGYILDVIDTTDTFKEINYSRNGIDWENIPNEMILDKGWSEPSLMIKALQKNYSELSREEELVVTSDQPIKAKIKCFTEKSEDVPKMVPMASKSTFWSRTLSWIIGPIVAGMLYGAYQSFHHWASNDNSNVQQSSISKSQNEFISLQVGAFTISYPSDWKVLSKAEAEILRDEMKQGVDQLVAQYSDSSKIQSYTYGIRDFTAIKISDDFGWCVLFNFKLPPQIDYYQTSMEESMQKIGHGLNQGVFKNIIENGIVSIGERKILKTVIEGKDGTRMTNIAYWTKKTSSIVTQLIIIESKNDASLNKQVNDIFTSLKIDEVE